MGGGGGGGGRGEEEVEAEEERAGDEGTLPTSVLCIGNGTLTTLRN